LTQPVIAITRDGPEYKAVQLNRRGHDFELLNFQSAPTDRHTWHSFVTAMSPPDRADGDVDLVIGFDASSVAFYRLNLPPVAPHEVAALVKPQAETLLPLPIDQMELAWRADEPLPDHVPVTIAAARTEQLGGFCSEVQSCRPTAILLPAEAIVKAWTQLFPTAADTAVIVHIAASHTHICLAQQRRLALALTSDVTGKDLAAGSPDFPQAAERLTQDIYSLQRRLADPAVAGAPVYVLSDATDALAAVTDHMHEAGLNASQLPISSAGLKHNSDISDARIFQLLVPIGLAMIALDQPDRRLNLFARWYDPARRDRKLRRLWPLKFTAPLAGVLALTALLLFYAGDVARLHRLDERLAALPGAPSIARLLRTDKIKKAIALQRPDILDLISTVHACGPDGVMLDAITFKRGQPVNILGHTKDKNKIYQFQEKLQQHADIKTVRVPNRTFDAKKKETSFTLTFEYRDFCRKKKK